VSLYYHTEVSVTALMGAWLCFGSWERAVIQTLR